MFLVAATNTNLIFADQTLQDYFEELDLLEALNPFGHSRLALAYDCTLVRFTTDGTNATKEFFQGWGFSLVSQPLPKFMRGYPAKYRFLRLGYSTLVGFISHPVSFLKFLREALSYLQSKK